MKLLLVRPTPPPHGGVSVHIAELSRRARAEGVPCHILNTDRYAPPSSEYIPTERATGFLFSLIHHALQGWTIHVHTNGHNVKSWLVALAGGAVGRLGPGSHLTLHSGNVPDYLNAGRRRRWLAGMTCRFFDRITCVSGHLHQALASLGVPAERLVVEPAFQGLARDSAHWVLPPQLEKWLESHQPVFTATGTARPEYGTELLVEAVYRLAQKNERVGCILMGIGPENNALRDLIESRNLTRSILLLGDLPHGECVHLMSRSNIFVRPTFSDGDSISVREALALDVPVVASDAAPRPEGTVLFETGNPDDLVRRIECTLQRQ